MSYSMAFKTIMLDQLQNNVAYCSAVALESMSDFPQFLNVFQTEDEEFLTNKMHPSFESSNSLWGYTCVIVGFLGSKY